MPATDLKNVLCYEDLLDAAPEASFAWCFPSSGSEAGSYLRLIDFCITQL